MDQIPQDSCRNLWGTVKTLGSTPTDEVEEGMLVSGDTEGVCLGGGSAMTLDLSVGATLGNIKL